jgi:hypothetical protein
MLSLDEFKDEDGVSIAARVKNSFYVEPTHREIS